MSELTEVEVWDRLRTSLRAAIDLSKKLAFIPAQGPNYQQLIIELQYVEDASRQMGAMRSDMRWHRFGYEMASFHQRAGDIIRSYGARQIFLRMAKTMEFMLARVDELKTAKTGRLGMILPKVQALHRDTRPVHHSGLILL